MTRYSPEHKTRTRRRIVRAAGRMFRAKGFASAGVDAVMKSAGLTHGGFYAHFRSKQALFAEAIRDAVLRSGSSLEEGLEDSEPREWLCAIVERYLSPEHLAGMRDGCPLPSLLSEIDRAPKAVKTAFHTAGMTRVESLARRFGAIGADDPEGEATSTFASLAGALAMARAMPDPEAAERIMGATRERLLERIRNMGS